MKKIDENMKVTLTVGQLRRVLSESWEDYQQEVSRKNEDMRSRIEKIAKMFEERGFVRDKRVIFGTPDNPSVRLFDPKKRNRVYLGTYLNQYSIDEKRHGEYLWIDEWADDYASINISPVYRHNGTNADVSVEITVSENKSKVSPDPTKWDYSLPHSIDRREKYIQIVKDESPFNYIEEENPVTVSRYGNTTRIAKLSSTAGDRSILNAVNKAIDMANAYTPADWSSYEKDPKDYHKDTQDIYHGKKSETEQNDMKKMNENTKVTLTIGQLKRLVKESESENEFREFFGVKSSRIHPVGDESFGGTEGRPKTYQNIEIDGVEAGYVERREASVGGVFAHHLKPDKYADHNVLFVLIVNPLDENGNEIDFDKEVGHDKDLSFPNEEWWEVRFKSEDEMLSAFDTLQRKFKGAAFDFSDEAIERIADWERENGFS